VHQGSGCPRSGIELTGAWEEWREALQYKGLHAALLGCWSRVAQAITVCPLSVRLGCTVWTGETRVQLKDVRRRATTMERTAQEVSAVKMALATRLEEVLAENRVRALRVGVSDNLLHAPLTALAPLVPSNTRVIERCVPSHLMWWVLEGGPGSKSCPSRGPPQCTRGGTTACCTGGAQCHGACALIYSFRWGYRGSAQTSPRVNVFYSFANNSTVSKMVRLCRYVVRWCVRARAPS